MPDTNPFVGGVIEGLSWKNIGKELASGAVSGAASFGVKLLFDAILGTQPVTEDQVRRLLERFAEQLREDFRNILREELPAAFDAEALRQVTFSTQFVASQLDAPRNSISLNMLENVIYVQASLARFSAMSLNELGFGMYFILLPMEMDIVAQLRVMTPTDPNVDRSMWRTRWLAEITQALETSEQVIYQMGAVIHNRNTRRVSFSSQGGPNLSPQSRRWVLCVDGVQVSEESYVSTQLRQVRDAQIARLDFEADQQILAPARVIVSTLARLRLTHTNPLDPSLLANVGILL